MNAGKRNSFSILKENAFALLATSRTGSISKVKFDEGGNGVFSTGDDCTPGYIREQGCNFKLPVRKATIKNWGTSLVAQWLRIHLPMQGTQVRALVQEDPTCHRATKPVCHNY